jgi:hypothetical protein
MRLFLDKVENSRNNSSSGGGGGDDDDDDNNNNNNNNNNVFVKVGSVRPWYMSNCWPGFISQLDMGPSNEGCPVIQICNHI